MDTIDITPTPEACRQIARLFRAQQARSEEMAACAERARVTHMREGLDALGPYADATDEDGEEEPNDALQSCR